MKKIFLLLSIVLSLYASGHKMSATDIDGNTLHITNKSNGIDIDEYKGKVVFVEFFGHKCPPCIASIPHYNHLMEKYKDKLQVVAIEVQGYTKSELKALAKNYNINYTLLTAQDAGEFYQLLSDRAGWRGAIPFLIAIDPNGVVKFIQAGMLPESALDTLVQKLSN